MTIFLIIMIPTAAFFGFAICIPTAAFFGFAICAMFQVAADADRQSEKYFAEKMEKAIEEEHA